LWHPLAHWLAVFVEYDKRVPSARCTHEIRLGLLDNSTVLADLHPTRQTAPATGRNPAIGAMFRNRTQGYPKFRPERRRLCAQCAPAADPGLTLPANKSATAAIASTAPMMAKVSLKPMMSAWCLTAFPIATIA